MDEAAPTEGTLSPEFRCPEEGSLGFDRFALSRFPLEHSSQSPHAPNLRIVCNNALFEKNGFDCELECRADHLSKRTLVNDKALTQTGWTTLPFSVEMCAPSALSSKNLIVLLHHAFRQGLGFKLRGALGGMLGSTARATKMMIASSKLADLGNFGETNIPTSSQNKNSVAGSKLENGSGIDESNIQGENTSSEYSINALNKNGMHAEAEDHNPLDILLGTPFDVEMPKNKLSLTLVQGDTEELSARDKDPWPHLLTTTACLSSWNNISNQDSRPCGHGVPAHVPQQGHVEATLKETVSGITSTVTASPHSCENLQARDTLCNKETNSTCNAISQEYPEATKWIAPGNFEGKVSCRASPKQTSYFNFEPEQTVSSCNFSSWSGQESNSFSSRCNLNIHKQWIKKFSRHKQELDGHLKCPNNDSIDGSVNAGFYSSYFHQNDQCFWSPWPACRCQCVPNKGPDTHSHYATNRFRPMAKSCPSFVPPLCHSQCQHRSIGQYIDKCLTVLPKQENPTAPLSCPTSSSPTYQCSKEQFACPVGCHMQSELIKGSSQGYASVFCDCFQPSEGSEEQMPSEHQVSLGCGKNLSSLKPKKLLWLSEEEAEIIRLIRLSQVKELSQCSSSYHASEQASPILSARVGSEVQDDVNLNEARNPTPFSSRISSSSREEISSRALEPINSSLGLKDSNCLLSEDNGLFFCGDSETVAPDNRDTINQRRRAATYIQHFWRKRARRKVVDLADAKRLEALKFVFEMPPSLEHLMQTAVMAMKSGKLESWHASLWGTALVIQRAWRQSVKIKKKRILASETFPQDWRELYKLISWRKTRKGITPPSFEKFLKLMERLQATTKGARIRRRLKSRRLQTIVREIKEIRVVLQDISGEVGLEPSLNLRSQLTMQLQQKLLQLQTALSGPQDAARVLLRRCPATPLVLCSSSKDMQSNTTVLPSSTAVESASLKTSNEDLFSSQKPEVSSTISLDMLSTESYVGPQKLNQQLECKITGLSAATQHGSSAASIKCDITSFPSAHVVPMKSEDSEKNKALNMGRLRQRNRNHGTVHDNNEILLGCHVDLKSCFLEGIVEKVENDLGQGQENTVSMLKENTSDIASVQTSSLHMEDSDSEELSQNSDVPRHPFLRRKSKAMPSQKLDWSKVKPMVSSRLEPELKTRLLKAKYRGTALFRKRSFNQIKSRLFSYEKSRYENNDDASNALFRQNVAEGSRKVLLSSPVESDVQPDVRSISFFKSKLHSCKQPSLRYPCNNDKKSAINVAADADSYANLIELPSNKVNGNKPSETFGFELSCKENNVVAFENQSKGQSHSKRYDNTKVSRNTGISETYPDTSATFHTTQQVRKGHLCFSQHETEQPPSELEKMYDEVINKQGQEVSLSAYFGANQQDSIVPRLHPNSSMFEYTRQQMVQIHKLLSKEGRAGRLQHNCLSFVSVRD